MYMNVYTYLLVVRIHMKLNLPSFSRLEIFSLMPETESNKYIYSNTLKCIFTEIMFRSQMRNVLFLFEIKEVLKALTNTDVGGERGVVEVHLTLTPNLPKILTWPLCSRLLLKIQSWRGKKSEKEREIDSQA